MKSSACAASTPTPPELNCTDAVVSSAARSAAGMTRKPSTYAPIAQMSASSESEIAPPRYAFVGWNELLTDAVSE